MNTEVKTLIPAILSYLSERGGLVSKTKLLKLLYLFDVEFYREHGATFTGFDWKFFHLGPWTSEFDPLLGDLKSSRVMEEIAYSAKEHEGVTLRATDQKPLRAALSNVRDESILIRILNDWGTEPTAKVLDHVYFQTEPMEHGVRDSRLDFSTVKPLIANRYKRTSSNTTKKEVERRKREYQARVESRRVQQGPPRKSTPARYDAEYEDALKTMERLQSS